MSDSVLMDKIPDCDICKQIGKKTLASYDAATRMGPWAYLCEEHYKKYAYGLGTGRGQKLILAA